MPTYKRELLSFVEDSPKDVTGIIYLIIKQLGGRVKISKSEMDKLNGVDVSEIIYGIIDDDNDFLELVNTPPECDRE